MALPIQIMSQNHEKSTGDTLNQSATCSGSCSCSENNSDEYGRDKHDIKLWLWKKLKWLKWRRKVHNSNVTKFVHSFVSQHGRVSGGHLTMIGSSPRLDFRICIEIQFHGVEAKKCCKCCIARLCWSHPAERHLSFRHLTIHKHSECIRCASSVAIVFFRLIFFLSGFSSRISNENEANGEKNAFKIYHFSLQHPEQLGIVKTQDDDEKKK